MDVRTIPNFVTATEREHFEKKAHEYREAGLLEANKAGGNRWAKTVNGTDMFDDVMNKVADRIIDAFDLQGMEIDPYLGYVISFIEPGGFIHPHTDRYGLYKDGKIKHLRCNVMVCKNSEMANPIISQRPFRVEERGLWAFFPSDHMHGTKTMANDKPRIVYQFGYAVPARYRIADAPPWPRILAG